MKTYRVLSIDAYRDVGGWSWNDWCHVRDAPAELIDATPREILRWMRAEGLLSDYSKGRTSIDDDQYNIVVCERGNGRPLFAIEYGADQ